MARPLRTEPRAGGDRSAPLRRLAWLLDSAIELPGGFRVGLDGIIGLVPVVGDAIAAVLSGYIVAQAARMGAPPGVLVRMLGNVLLEAVIGMVPVFGDVFDFAFKANERNVRLLEGSMDAPHESLATRRRVPRFRVAVGLVVAAALGVVAGVLWLGYRFAVLGWDALVRATGVA